MTDTLTVSRRRLNLVILDIHLASVKDRELKIFENRILRRIFGLKRDGNGELRRLHNEKLHSLYRSPNIVRVIKSRRLRWAGHVARMEEGGSAFKILTDKHTGKRPLGRPRRRWDKYMRLFSIQFIKLCNCS